MSSKPYRLPSGGRLIDRTLLKTINVKGNWQATANDMVSVLYFNGAKEKFGRGTGRVGTGQVEDHHVRAMRGQHARRARAR